jgi:hypothetical protein
LATLGLAVIAIVWAGVAGWCVGENTTKADIASAPKIPVTHPR